MGEQKDLSEIITPTFILLLVVASTNAHNWLNSLSRSTGANTRKPAAPSKTGQPHAQVAAGQFLQAEWVQGHGSDSYFILVAEKDYNQLNKHTDEKLLNAYLSEAGATKGVPSRMHTKYHRVYSTGTPSRNHGSRNNYFTGFVPRTAAHFIERDRMFSGRFTGAPRGRGNDLDPKNVHQAIYPNDCTKTDRYSAHKSSKYAWILSVWKFRICIHNPNRPDVAGFQIPPGTPPGKYFLHWKWRGYYDIIDVQVVTGAPVANPYGAKLAPGATPPPAAWKRIEHCEFLKPQKTYGCLALKDGESEEQCLKDCARSAFKDCNGVNVVTVHNPTSVYPAFRDMVNIPFGAQCPKQTLEVNPPNSRRRACYSLITREDSDLPDEQELIATEDPDEPAFYSTCWKRLPPTSTARQRSCLVTNAFRVTKRSPISTQRNRSIGTLKRKIARTARCARCQQRRHSRKCSWARASAAFIWCARRATCARSRFSQAKRFRCQTPTSRL